MHYFLKKVIMERYRGFDKEKLCVIRDIRLILCADDPTVIDINKIKSDNHILLELKNIYDTFNVLYYYYFVPYGGCTNVTSWNMIMSVSQIQSNDRLIRSLVQYNLSKFGLQFIEHMDSSDQNITDLITLFEQRRIPLDLQQLTTKYSNEIKMNEIRKSAYTNISMDITCAETEIRKMLQLMSNIKPTMFDLMSVDIQVEHILSGLLYCELHDDYKHNCLCTGCDRVWNILQNLISDIMRLDEKKNLIECFIPAPF